MKRKKATIKRTRRSPYERSLEYATKRLAKAIDERAHAAHKLEDLDKEIPYLQTVIRALTPVDTSRMGKVLTRAATSIFRPSPIQPGQVVTVNVDELPSEEDQFLNVTIPGEKEVLP